MKTSWVKKVYQFCLLLGLLAVGGSLVGCADTYYGAYPAYRGGYYASYSGAPYYGYGYGYPYRGYGYGAYGYPYRSYGPYYGGSPYYGGTSVVVSSNRGYYTYRDRYGRLHTARNVKRSQGTRRTQTQTREVQRSESDDERRYYSRP
jgi:hypothetical protein